MAWQEQLRRFGLALRLAYRSALALVGIPLLKVLLAPLHDRSASRLRVSFTPAAGASGGSDSDGRIGFASFSVVRSPAGFAEARGTRRVIRLKTAAAKLVEVHAEKYRASMMQLSTSFYAEAA
jgi:hypothetical protein